MIYKNNERKKITFCFYRKIFMYRLKIWAKTVHVSSRGNRIYFFTQCVKRSKWKIITWNPSVIVSLRLFCNIVNHVGSRLSVYSNNLSLSISLKGSSFNRQYIFPSSKIFWKTESTLHIESFMKIFMSFSLTILFFSTNVNYSNIKAWSIPQVVFSTLTEKVNRTAILWEFFVLLSP